MLTKLHSNNKLQLVLGLVTGILFGFLLQKGGVTKYDVIINQLLLTDFTVVKIMLSAVVTGMVLVHLLRSFGLAELHPKFGGLGQTVIGGLLFGIGFGTLGYCPGTLAGAVGNGYLDALVGGLAGAIIGAGLFAVWYPKLKETILRKGWFGDVTLPQLFKVNAWVVVIPVAAGIVCLLIWVEHMWPYKP
jgi:uncharacterized membrane protein YedE/YeeE